MFDKIEKVLDEKVRPELKHHGGNVIVTNFSDGILEVELVGQCSECSSAALTTENLIQNELQKVLPEISDVILVRRVSDELLDFAYKIFKHEI